MNRIVYKKHNSCAMRETTRTSNSLRDKIANVNVLYDHIVHALQNTIDS